MNDAIEVLKDYLNPKTEKRERENQWCEKYSYKAKLYRYNPTQFKHAIGEALLALEREEKRKSMKVGEIISEEIERLHKEKKELKEWLEKEIASKEADVKISKVFAQSYSDKSNTNMCEKDFLDDIEKIEIENIILKEVLERVGEQK